MLVSAKAGTKISETGIVRREVSAEIRIGNEGRELRAETLPFSL